MTHVDRLILAASKDVQALFEHAFAASGAEAAEGTARDVLEGDRPVVEYVDVGEPGLALEHVIYLVEEHALPLSNATFDRIERAGRAMSMDPGLWERLRARVVDD